MLLNLSERKSSKDAWPFEKCNEQYLASMSKAEFHMTKHSSSSALSSESILSHKYDTSTVQHSSGKALHPRVKKEALSK